MSKTKEINYLNINMLANGFKTSHTDFFESKEYKDLAAEMIRYFPNYRNDLKLKKCTKSQLLQAGKEVIDKHTYGTDTRVRYVDMDTLNSQLYYLFGDKPKEEQYDEIIDYIENNIEIIKVTDVPIELDFSRCRNGHTGLTWFYGPREVNEDFHKRIKPVVKKISIEGACDDDTKCTYVHEMYHALTNSHKGSIENLLHDEVLSIYMEKIAALDLDETGKLEKTKRLIRLLDNKRDILSREQYKYMDEKPMDRLNLEQYIVSSAVATALYDTYRKSNKQIKKEIDDSINGIFREEHTLEDVLQQYDATPERGSNIMRRHIKKLSK